MPRPFDKARFDDDERVERFGPADDIRRFHAGEAAPRSRAEDAYQVATSGKTTTGLRALREVVLRAEKRPVGPFTRGEWWRRFAGWAVAGSIVGAIVKASIESKGQKNVD